MWRKANLRRWIRAFRRHPKMGLAGFAVGLLLGAFGTFVDHLGGHQDVSSVWFYRFLIMSPGLNALLGIAVFIWVAGTFRLPRQRVAIFVICIFPAAMMERLLIAIVRTISRTIA
jgi:hypothetical protein